MFWALNVADTCWFPFIVTGQVEEYPLQASPHPTKLELSGVSVSVTSVPAEKLALHVPGQLIPEGLLVTVPELFPGRVTDNVGIMLKVAVTCRFPFIVTEQVEEFPLHAPLHPAKVEFVPGVSLSVTWVPTLKFQLHVWGQLIP
jgi:hypothetical protein